MTSSMVWTRSAATATSVAPLVAVLVWGTALNGVMHFPYALQLAFGRTRLPLTINAILIGVSAPITVVLTATHGVIGGAASWVIMNGIYVVLGTWLTHRLLMPRAGGVWFARNVLLPLIVSLVVIAPVAWLAHEAALSALARLTLAAVAAVAAFGANVSLDRTAIERFLRSAGLAGVFKGRDGATEPEASETPSE